MRQKRTKRRTVATIALNAISGVVIVAVLVFNSRLHVPPAPPVTGPIPDDAPAQLAFLRNALESGAGQDMQQLFPEGDFFTHVLYGLSWVNVGLHADLGSAARTEALAEARWAWKRLGREQSRRPFNASVSLPLRDGVFYRGWRAYLLAGILLLQSPGDQSRRVLRHAAVHHD